MKRNFNFQKGPPPREVCLGATSLYHAGVSLGEEEFYFPKGTPPHARSAMVRDTYLGHDGVSPGKTLCIRNQSLKNLSTSQNYPLCCIPRCSVIILTKARDLTTIANIYFIDRFAIETVDGLCRSCPLLVSQGKESSLIEY